MNGFAMTVKALSNYPEGTSSYHLTKELGISKTSVNYHLDDLKEKGFLDILGRGKIRLNKDVFPTKGVLVLVDKNEGYVHILQCEYFDQCDCVGVFNKDCQKFKELPVYIKDMIETEE